MTISKGLVSAVNICLLSTALVLRADPSSDQKIVVNDADLARINADRADILHNASIVSLSSAVAPYINCDGYRDLLVLDNKITPILIMDLVRSENAQIKYGKNHFSPYPKDDAQWLRLAEQEQQEIRSSTIPRFICLKILAGTTFGKANHRTGLDGIEETYSWLEWWKENNNLYDLRLKDSEKYESDLDEGKRWPFLSCKTNHGLLDVRAVRSTFKNIIENAAAEAGVKVVVGDDGNKTSYIGGLTNVIMAVNYRQMTFDEFARAITEQLRLGFPWKKEGDTYYFGGGDPAPGRWMMADKFDDLVCEIKMDRTVFNIGESMRLGISLRYVGRKSEDIEILARVPLDDNPAFVINIVDENGKLLSNHRASRIRAAVMPTMKFGGANSPKQFMAEIDLSQIFSISQPGDYTVTVSYKVGQDLNAGKPIWRGETVSGAVYLKILK
jgi:hypothetical protein